MEIWLPSFRAFLWARMRIYTDLSNFTSSFLRKNKFQSINYSIRPRIGSGHWKIRRLSLRLRELKIWELLLPLFKGKVVDKQILLLIFKKNMELAIKKRLKNQKIVRKNHDLWIKYQQLSILSSFSRVKYTKIISLQNN